MIKKCNTQNNLEEKWFISVTDTERESPLWWRHGNAKASMGQEQKTGDHIISAQREYVMESSHKNLKGCPL